MPVAGPAVGSGTDRLIHRYIVAISDHHEFVRPFFRDVRNLEENHENLIDTRPIDAARYGGGSNRGESRGTEFQSGPLR
jgi:hypothetical protein